MSIPRISAHQLFDSCQISIQKDRVPDVPVAGVVCNSRKVVPGSIFVAVRGTHQNGEDFIPEAIKNGARIILSKDEISVDQNISLVRVQDPRHAYAVLNHAFWGKPAHALRLVGITGTNGKTTSSWLLQEMLQEVFRCGLVGTIHQDDGKTRQASSQTTPDPDVLHPLFKRMVQNGCEAAVVEVSSHALDQNRLAGVFFDATLFTNLTQDHLDYHKTMEKYLESKAKLVKQMKPQGLVVLNDDEPHFKKLLRLPLERCLTYGTQEGSHFRATDIASDLEGSRFKLHFNGEMLDVTTSMVGRHNVYNILGAVATAHGLGVPLESCLRAVERFRGVPGRLERLETGLGFDLFLDYAHTEDGLYHVLSSVKPHVSRKLHLLFGCGGDRDKDKRAKMARVAEQFADRVIVTSDNPRTENPRRIAQDVREGFTKDFNHFQIQLDRRKGLRQALLEARSGDVVVVAGKGHEDYQIVGSQRIHFSDKEECLRILRGL